MADKVKFGIIGTGAIATMHAEALRDAKNAELTARFCPDILELKRRLLSDEA